MQQRRTLLLPFLVGVIGFCFLLLTPPGAAPDEPTHLIRAGAVIRGQVGGEFDPTFDNAGGEIVEVPDWLMVPDHKCYAWIENRTRSVDCSDTIDYTGKTVELRTSAEDYPPWAHLIYSVGTLIPGVPAVWPARLLGLLVSSAMIGTVLTRMPTRWSRTALLAAVTPMVYATIATVNPSAFAISGAIAMWAVLWNSPVGTPNRREGQRRHRGGNPSAGEVTDPQGIARVAGGSSPAAVIPAQALRWSSAGHRLNDGWVFVFGWMLLGMTRRDGLTWASMIVAFTSIASGHLGIGSILRLPRAPLVVFSLTTTAQVLWGLSTLHFTAVIASFSLLFIPAADGMRMLWDRTRTRAERSRLIVVASLLGVLSLLLVMVVRPGGWNTNLAFVVAQEATDHALQAIGVLGWLDVYLPDVALQLAVVAFGIMFGVALVRRPIAAAQSAGVLVVAVVAAWAFEMMTGIEYGQYWQGRYSLPFLVGVPLVLGTVTWASSDDPGGRTERRLSLTVVSIIMLVVNAAAWAAARRWGVGTEGSYAPWDWWSKHQPLPPMIPLMVIAAATAWVVYLIASQSPAGEGVDGDRLGREVVGS